MPITLQNESQITSYLLGRLSAEEMLQLEAEMLMDDDLYDLLEIRENELIEEYVNGQIISADLELFKSHFLTSPERRERVAIARELRQVTAEHRQAQKGKAATDTHLVKDESAVGTRQRPGWWSWFALPQFGLVAAVCLLLLTGLSIWFFVRNGQLQAQLQREQVARAALEQQTASQSAQVESLQQQIETEKNERRAAEENYQRLLQGDRAAVPALFSAVLNMFVAGLPKGEGSVPAQKLTIPTQAKVARLQFPLQTDRFTRYNVALLRLEGTTRKELKKISALTATGRTLKVQLPAALLQPGRYALQMTGIGADNETESVGEYRFDVVRAP